MSTVDANVRAPMHKSAEVLRPFPRVLHVTSWLSRKGGGIPPVISALNREMNSRGVGSRVAGLLDPFVVEDCAGENPPPFAGRILGPHSVGCSPELQRHIRAIVKKGDVVHSHGVWMHPGWAARKCARQTGAALVISPHGMLEPWALNNSRFKKRMAGYLFENRNLRDADCLHALCSAEAENFRQYGLKNSIAIIPNGVSADELLPPFPDTRAEEFFPSPKGRRRLLFLSRLHPKKGLENLIIAWHQLAREFSDWNLVIAGSGNPAYTTKLNALAEAGRGSGTIVFTGPVYGDAKKSLLYSSHAFVLPSFSEGFSMAILEAAAAGLPVVLTRECNFPELAKAGGAIEITPSAVETEATLRHILLFSDEQRKAMGQRGKELVQKSYTWPVIAGQMCAVYQWLTGSAPKPATIIA